MPKKSLAELANCDFETRYRNIGSLMFKLQKAIFQGSEVLVDCACINLSTELTELKGIVDEIDRRLQMNIIL